MRKLFEVSTQDDIECSDVIRFVIHCAETGAVMAYATMQLNNSGSQTSLNISPTDNGDIMPQHMPEIAEAICSHIDEKLGQ